MKAMSLSALVIKRVLTLLCCFGVAKRLERLTALF